MDDATRLKILRSDLQRTGNLPGEDDYLSHLLQVAKDSLARQGIRDDGTEAYNQLIIGTAAWIYRKRITGEAEPMYLRRLRLDWIVDSAAGGGLLAP